MSPVKEKRSAHFISSDDSDEESYDGTLSGLLKEIEEVVTKKPEPLQIFNTKEARDKILKNYRRSIVERGIKSPIKNKITSTPFGGKTLYKDGPGLYSASISTINDSNAENDVGGNRDRTAVVVLEKRSKSQLLEIAKRFSDKQNVSEDVPKKNDDTRGDPRAEKTLKAQNLEIVSDKQNVLSCRKNLRSNTRLNNKSKKTKSKIPKMHRQAKVDVEEEDDEKEEILSIPQKPTGKSADRTKPQRSENKNNENRQDILVKQNKGVRINTECQTSLPVEKSHREVRIEREDVRRKPSPAVKTRSTTTRGNLAESNKSKRAVAKERILVLENASAQTSYQPPTPPSRVKVLKNCSIQTTLPSPSSSPVPEENDKKTKDFTQQFILSPKVDVTQKSVACAKQNRTLEKCVDEHAKMGSERDGDDIDDDDIDDSEDLESYVPAQQLLKRRLELASFYANEKPTPAVGPQAIKKARLEGIAHKLVEGTNSGILKTIGNPTTTSSNQPPRRKTPTSKRNEYKSAVSDTSSCVNLFSDRPYLQGRTDAPVSRSLGPNSDDITTSFDSEVLKEVYDGPWRFVTPNVKRLARRPQSENVKTPGFLKSLVPARADDKRSTLKPGRILTTRDELGYENDFTDSSYVSERNVVHDGKRRECHRDQAVALVTKESKTKSPRKKIKVKKSESENQISDLRHNRSKPFKYGIVHNFLDESDDRTLVQQEHSKKNVRQKNTNRDEEFFISSDEEDVDLRKREFRSSSKKRKDKRKNNRQKILVYSSDDECRTCTPPRTHKHFEEVPKVKENARNLQEKDLTSSDEEKRECLNKSHRSRLEKPKGFKDLSQPKDMSRFETHADVFSHHRNMSNTTDRSPKNHIEAKNRSDRSPKNHIEAKNRSDRSPKNHIETKNRSDRSSKNQIEVKNRPDRSPKNDIEDKNHQEKYTNPSYVERESLQQSSTRERENPVSEKYDRSITYDPDADKTVSFFFARPKERSRRSDRVYSHSSKDTSTGNKNDSIRAESVNHVMPDTPPHSCSDQHQIGNTIEDTPRQTDRISPNKRSGTDVVKKGRGGKINILSNRTIIQAQPDDMPSTSKVNPSNQIVADVIVHLTHDEVRSDTSHRNSSQTSKTVRNNDSPDGIDVIIEDDEPHHSTVQADVSRNKNTSKKAIDTVTETNELDSDAMAVSSSGTAKKSKAKNIKKTEKQKKQKKAPRSGNKRNARHKEAEAVEVVGNIESTTEDNACLRRSSRKREVKGFYREFKSLEDLERFRELMRYEHYVAAYKKLTGEDVEMSKTIKQKKPKSQSKSRKQKEISNITMDNKRKVEKKNVKKGARHRRGSQLSNHDQPELDVQNYAEEVDVHEEDIPLTDTELPSSTVNLSRDLSLTKSKKKTSSRKKTNNASETLQNEDNMSVLDEQIRKMARYNANEVPLQTFWSTPSLDACLGNFSIDPWGFKEGAENSEYDMGFFIKSGNCQLNYSGQSVRLVENHNFILPRDTSYTLTNVSPDQLQISYFGVKPRS